jgi:hypothetical protein
LIADMCDPVCTITIRSNNHGGCGQNVCHEDGSVRYVTICITPGCKDNFYRNDSGQVAPGEHENDSVIAHGGVSPWKVMATAR